MSRPAALVLRPVFTLLVFGLVSLGCLGMGSNAYASNLTGARLIPQYDQSVRAMMGFPDLEVAYHMPWDQKFELIPRAQLSYGRGLDTRFRFFTAGLDTRVALPRPTWGGKFRDKLHWALLLRLSMLWETEPTRQTAVGLGCPGIVVTYVASKNLDINVGARLLDYFFLTGDVGLETTLSMSLGAEYKLSETWRGIFLFDAGPALGVDDRVKGSIRAVFGVGYNL